MGLFSRLFGQSSAQPAPHPQAAEEQKSVYVSPELMAAFYGASFGVQTNSGASVSTYTALQVTAFYAAARVIAQGIAQLPVEVYKRSGKGSEPAPDHPLYDLLRYEPSELQDAVQFLQTMVMHAVTTGNAIAYKVTVGGELRELLPIRPESFAIDLEQWSGRKRISLTFENGGSAEVGAEEVFHLMGPSWRGFTGLDPALIGREAIGLSRVTEESQARMHANGVRPSGVLTTDQRLSQEQVDRLRDEWMRVQGGVANSSKTAILSGGLKFEAMAMTGVDAQHLETRKHQISEICRLLGIFPIMIGHADDQSPTFASSSEFFAAHVRHTLMPWVKGLQAALEKQLLSRDERKEGYFIRIDTSELMRGNTKERAEWYKAALGTNSNPGWMTPNEVREDDGWNPLPGLDEVMSPLTMTPAPQNNDPNAEGAPSGEPSSDVEEPADGGDNPESDGGENG